MRDWFETLDQREKAFVTGGAAVVVLVLFYVLIWMPLARNHEELSSNVEIWERSIAALRPLKGMQLPDNIDDRTLASAAGQTPVVIVDLTLRARGLDGSLKRSQPTTSNGIRVEFENVAFDDLVIWLGDLSSQYAMDVTSGSFSKANRPEPGRINATLTLERSL